MNKTYQAELGRRFLIEGLPEPLTRASRHLQIFDNYITGTWMRIRSVRDPETKEWSWALQQRLVSATAEILSVKIAEIHLNEAEHAVLEPFEGNEIRKNRYFHEVDGLAFAFDVYLGPLWGLNIANADFGDEVSRLGYEPPSFAVFEISNNEFFLGDNLVGKKFEDVQAEVARIGAARGFLTRAADSDLG